MTHCLALIPCPFSHREKGISFRGLPPPPHFFQERFIRFWYDLSKQRITGCRSTAVRLDHKIARAVDNSSSHGAGCIAIPAKRTRDAGVGWVPRADNAYNRLSVLEDGQVLDVQTIIWATGYQPDYRWVEAMPLNRYGYPVHGRSVVDANRVCTSWGWCSSLAYGR